MERVGLGVGIGTVVEFGVGAGKSWEEGRVGVQESWVLGLGLKLELGLGLELGLW